MKNSAYKFIGFILFVFFIWMPQTHAQRYWNVAAKFEGNEQSYIEVSPYSTLQNLSGSFTVECWFYCEPGGQGTLFGKNGFRLLIDPASGIYFYTIQATSVDGRQNYKDTKKMIFLK